MATNVLISRAKTKQIRILDVTAASSATYGLAAGHGIVSIFYRERGNAAVTGGVKIGTTLGGTEIVAAQAVTALQFGYVTQATLLARWFSATAPTPLYIDAVTSWNSARVDLFIVIEKLIP